MTQKYVKLNSGYECPMLGYGTWQANTAETLKAGVKAAVEAGYRHIDTAQSYRNEEVIGEALQELYDAGTVKREDLYLVTKVIGTHFRPDLLIAQLKSQLVKLKTNYIDLYLVHFPVALQPPDEGQLFKMVDGKFALDLETKLEDTWKAMEEGVRLGLTRSIGISNFNISQVERILKIATIPPAMIQVESHPGFQNKKLIEFCQSKGIAATGYSCFGSPGTVLPNGKVMIDLKLLEDERIINIGKKYGKTSAQTILRYQIQRNVCCIPKSLNAARIADNFKIWDFELNDEDMKIMASMDQNKRFAWIQFPGVAEHPEYPFAADGMSG